MIPSSIRDRVRQKIKTQNVRPLPAWLFSVREDLFWVCTVLSMGLGGAVASLSILLLRQEELDLFALSLIDRDAFTLLITLPLLWIAILILLCGVTIFNLRHTKGGYKWHLSTVLSMSIIGSMTLGALLHVTNWNESFDVLLRENIATYQELRDRRMQLWSNPEEGMLAGTLEEARGGFLFVRDFDEVLWEIDVRSAKVPPRSVLQTGMPLRVLGYSLEEDRFVAESVRPWRPRRWGSIF